jgi:hypothetical protein
MPRPVCPQCNTKDVKAIESWRISPDAKAGEPLAMWACKNPACLYRWPREPEAPSDPPKP